MRFFNRVTLQTPESVELEFTLAGIGNRVYALIVDYTIWSFLLVTSWFLFLFISIQLADFITNIFPDDETMQLWLISIQLLISFSIYVGYFVFFEVIWQGQTPGKRLAKIRVIRDDGRPISLPQATLRALLRPIDELMLCLGAFFIIFSKQEKRIGDLVAGTIVIQEERPIKTIDFEISDDAQDLVTQLQIEADLVQLLPEDFAVVREYLQRRKAMTPEAREKLSRKLAYQIKDLIAWEPIPQGITTNVFLEAIYLAYQQQSSTPPEGL